MPQNDLGTRVAALNARYRHHSATEVLAHALATRQRGGWRWCRASGPNRWCSAHGGGDAPGDAGDLHRHGNALCRDAGLSAGAGRAAGPARSAHHPPRRHDLARTDPAQTLIPTRYRRLLRPAQDPAPASRARRVRRLDHRAQALSGRHPRRARFLRGGGRHRPASRSTRWPIGRARMCRPTWRKTACPGIRWWQRAIPPSAACPAPRRCDRMKIPAQAAGAIRTRPNAASTSWMAASSAKESPHDHHRHRPGLWPR